MDTSVGLTGCPLIVIIIAIAIAIAIAGQTAEPNGLTFLNYFFKNIFFFLQNWI